MPEHRILIKGGRVIDPAADRDGPADVLVVGDRVKRVAPKIAAAKGATVVEASGAWVLPGLIDLHVHLREPGYEYKETILTGSRAAVAGGFTSVACMPNTDPPNDNASVTMDILKKAAAAGLARVYPVGCVTAGQKGEKLAEIGSLVAAGCRGISDDGRPVENAAVMRRAMEYSRMFGIPVIAHCEDLSLAGGGSMHEGVLSDRLGMPAIPAAAEEVMVARDIVLCRATGCRLHLAHVSTRGSVALIKAAKDEGLPVTAEVTPHHLLLTDEAVASFDTSTKVNPPLRSEEDRAALCAALEEGVIDVVATDHAPHNAVDKDVEYAAAAFGIVGLETALPLVLSLVERGDLSLRRAVEAMTAAPAAVLDLEGGSLRAGAPADIAVVNPEESFEVDPSAFHSKGKNSPFAGRTLRGRVSLTVVGGRIVYRDGRPLDGASA